MICIIHCPHQMFQAFYLGEGDFHETKYDDFDLQVPFYISEKYITDWKDIEGHCVYYFHVYPTSEFEERYHDKLPALATMLVAAVFFFLFFAFLLYNRFVERRDQKMKSAVKKTTGIVSSLFPENVRDRILEEAIPVESNKGLLSSFLGKETEVTVDPTSSAAKPIADLFTATTIMFLDICGFTAWSSMREPTRVFVLLETLYLAFDELARMRRIYKVETIGDCYVAVAGLPTPRKDHAVVMVRFAMDCLIRMKQLLKELEVLLGPDTTELDARVGLHSGPVTAGVLRGERSRFHFFGDTMNTASRMESTGVGGAIQLSPQTAELLRAAGKGHWLVARESPVHAKGKGEMQTHWLSMPQLSRASSQLEYSSTDSDPVLEEVPDITPESQVSEKHQRLIDWNVDMLSTALEKVIASRDETSVDDYDKSFGKDVDSMKVQEVVHFPVEPRAMMQPVTSLSGCVLVELKEFTATISSLYKDSAFHNFEHASHVTMSVVKLLSRVVACDVECEYAGVISSDPLVQFACIFSALIHDVDHSGMPNHQLIKENPALAQLYKTSAAERNSLDIAWTLLRQDKFSSLWEAICGQIEEQILFRQLIVTALLSTDIMDGELRALRHRRWVRAFSSGSFDLKEDSDRKATAIIAHLMQASDVAHTMQHWLVYTKWNSKLFEEMYLAWKSGRAEKDPSVDWYEGEIAFFDKYIIPLALKLKECRVFGVSSDEYLGFAQQNRDEWVRKGQEIVENLVAKFSS